MGTSIRIQLTKIEGSYNKFIAYGGSADTGKFMRTRIVTARKHSCTQCTGNPADNSKRTQDWLKKIWPPSSIACSPVDYLAWGVSELRIRAQLHN
jgi:hypothetical protein